MHNRCITPSSMFFALFTFVAYLRPRLAPTYRALPRPDTVWLTEFRAFPTPLWYICQLLFWFLSMQLRSDVQYLCADLPRSDAVRLTEFVAIPMPLSGTSASCCFGSCPCNYARMCNTFALTCRVLMLIG